MADYMMALVLECFQNDRLDHLKMAQNYYLNFLEQCLRYDLVSKDAPEYPELSRYILEDKDSDDVREERFENWLKNVPRDVKIDRMKQIMQLKKRNENENIINEIALDKVDNSEDEGESVPSFWKDWIRCCVLMTLDKWGLLLREKELLLLGENVDNLEKSKNNTASPVSNMTRIEKPFKLVRDRKQVGSDVFKYGHNLPTMTIDEYLDLERKRGNIITGGGAASAIKKEIDEDDEELMEIELKKAREFDEFKDSKEQMRVKDALIFVSLL